MRAEVMDSENNATPVVVARAVRVKGLKGEIVAELLTDFPDRFQDIVQFFAISPQGEQITIVLERFALPPQMQWQASSMLISASTIYPPFQN